MDLQLPGRARRTIHGVPKLYALCGRCVIVELNKSNSLKSEHKGNTKVFFPIKGLATLPLIGIYHTNCRDLAKQRGGECPLSEEKYL